MPLQTGPCAAWPVDLLCCDLPEDTSQETIDRWALVATHVLWALSGRRIGPCPVTVRPCRRACLDAWPGPVQWSGSPWVPYLGRDGQWRNASVCGCVSDCSCGELCEVKLAVPVASVTEVTVDGEVLPPEAYRVDNDGLLVRTDGGCWPDCQDMAAPAGTDGTFAVTYQWGLPVDAAAVAAVSDLTCHLIKGCSGSGACGCKANRNMTRLSRQGVDFEFADPTAIYAEGRTGLMLVDLWLTTVNPHRLTSPSRVYSPDYKPARVTTWP